MIPPFEHALQELATNLRDVEQHGPDSAHHKLHVGFEGAFGDLHTTPRSLSSRFLSHLVCLDGIVTSCSLVRPKLMRSVHWSEKGKAFLAKEYHDNTMITQQGQAGLGSNAYPTEDGNGARLVSEFGWSTYRDYQTITLQEMPERAPPGQLPRAVDIILDDDLVDTVKPGDRARVVGVYKSMASVYNGQVPSTFRAVLIANNVRMVGRDTMAPRLTDQDVRRIRQLAARRDCFERVAEAMAPSIYGHEFVKKAVLLQMLGGVEKNLANGTHIRGDINIMLVGDPSTAKSQMLRFILGIARWRSPRREEGAAGWGSPRQSFRTRRRGSGGSRRGRWSSLTEGSSASTSSTR